MHYLAVKGNAQCLLVPALLPSVLLLYLVLGNFCAVGVVGARFCAVVVVDA